MGKPGPPPPTPAPPFSPAPRCSSSPLQGHHLDRGFTWHVAVRPPPIRALRSNFICLHSTAQKSSQKLWRPRPSLAPNAADKSIRTLATTLVWSSGLYHVAPEDLPSFPTSTCPESLCSRRPAFQTSTRMATTAMSPPSNRIQF